MKSLDLRNRFFDFFSKHGHTKVASSSVIPAEDPTLLFTNAGMNQFKDLFLGKEVRNYKTAVTIQKCIRAGGKHNDLDNVGFTKRHLTFFEMMGNFSFGDYFKKEAILYAWNFLTQELGLPADQLHATVFKTDDEAYAIWNTTVGLPENRIHRLGEATNFWQMGDTGPCGPCSEIFIDRGLSYGSATDTPETDSDRFLEIWNLVFMQYNRTVDGTLNPLQQTGVDTGMGLERLALVMQGVDSVFQTDLFTSIIGHIESKTSIVYADQTAERKAAFHVLADHIRSTVFLIAEGIVPSNEGRGYVLRKIIRRAALFAQKIDINFSFAELVSPVIADFATIYPELVAHEVRITQTISQEIEKFSHNLLRGTTLLAQLCTTAAQTDKTIKGSDIFKLYDTFGFPVELINAEARQKGFTVDMNGFEIAMEQQRLQSGQKKTDPLDTFAFSSATTTEFTGYHELTTQGLVTGIIVDNTEQSKLAKNSQGWIITNKSPFFIVGGGQVPDQGTITIGNHTVPILQVRFIGKEHAIGVLINAPIDIAIGTEIIQTVDKTLREHAMKNHTATHLLQAALIEHFGPHIKQAGSLVHPDYLRFDFTCVNQITQSDISTIERIVNEKIMAGIPVNVNYMTLDEAKAAGALAFFGDKYKPEKVRMISVDQFSKELCGGTHVQNTGHIGLCKITETLAPAAGLKRIVAVTGFKALELAQERFVQIKELSTMLKAKPEQLTTAITQQKEQQKDQAQQITELKQMYINNMIQQWIGQGKTVGNQYQLDIPLTPLLCTELLSIAKKIKDSIQHDNYLCILSTTINQALRFAVIASYNLDQASNALKLEGFGAHYTNGILQGGGTISKEQLVSIIATNRN